MNTALQLINDPTIVESEERLGNNNLILLPAAQLSRDNLQLRVVIRSLREELARAEHSLTAHKILLQNVRIRESELRAELMERRQ